MGAFELNNREQVQGVNANAEVAGAGNRRLREECIIALKVYDMCRQLRCKLIHPKLPWKRKALSTMQKKPKRAK